MKMSGRVNWEVDPDKVSLDPNSNSVNFTPYCLDSGVVSWIDILGVRSKPDNELQLILSDAAKYAAIASGHAISLNGQPPIASAHTLCQFALVGDALLLVQKDSEGDEDIRCHQIGVVWNALLLSRFLFEKGYPHRGVIHKGSFFTDINAAGSIISGRAPIEAFQLEQEIKAIGLYATEEMQDLVSWSMQVHNPQSKYFQSTKKLCWSKRKQVAHLPFACSNGKQREALLKMQGNHKYIKNGKTLTQLVSP